MRFPIRSGSLRKKVALSLEHLEDRTVPAGNITATVFGGVLQVQGDSAANQVWVEGLGGGQAIITGLGGTTVNGGGPVVLGGIEFAYDIRLGDGDDGLWVTGAQGNKALWVDMGAGNDGLAVVAAWNTGPNVFVMGAGNDSISVASAIWDNVTFFDMGDGDDNFAVDGVQFGSALFNGGAGANSAAMANVTFLTMPTGVGIQSFSPILGLLANADSAVVGQNGTVTINVLANDSSPGGGLDPSSVTITTPPQNGTAVVNGDGTITYTATATGATADSFQYTVRNTAGVVSSPAVVSLTLGSGSQPSGRGPRPTITTTADNTTNLTAIPFTVSFDKAVTGFEVSEVFVTNGSVSGFTALDARRYTFIVSPTSDGTVTVRIPRGAATDSAGNTSVAASFSLTADTPPRLTLRAVNSASGTGPIQFNATINQAATGFTAEDVVVTGGTVSDFVTTNSRAFRFTVTPGTSGEVVQINVAAGAFTDSTGNPSLATQFATTPTRTDDGMLPTTSPPDANDPNWQTQPNGLKIWTVETGTGPAVAADSTIGVFYTGWLLDGTVFDSSRTAGSPSSFALTGLIQGWQQAIPGMQPGGILRLYIPAALGYGSTGSGSVPPNADLIFEIKLISVT